MNTHSKLFAGMTAACVLGIVQSPRAAAVVSDEDFQKLVSRVGQLDDKVQTLEQTHEKDQQTIKRLQGQVGKTKEIATDAQQKADAASEKLQQPVSAASTLSNAATHNFVLAGDAEVQFAKVAHQHGAFVMADFAPIFLFRANDNILFEAGFDFILQNNAPNGGGYNTTVNLSFATIDYLVNDYVTVVAGNMLLPLGTYSERSAGWLNKIPDAPLPRSILPGNGIGAQLRGAIPIGQGGQSLTYSAYAANGPGSVDGTGNAGQLDLGGNVGFTSDGRTANLHGGMAGGGRFGYFCPFGKPQYDMEVGVSGMSGAWDDADRRQYSAGVADFALHLGPAVEVKGEYISTWVDTDDQGTLTPKGWWVQAGYKLSGLNLDLPYISSLELVGRYDTLNDGLGTTTKRGTVGAVYYLSNTLWLEGDYEWTSNQGPNPVPADTLLFQISYGF